MSNLERARRRRLELEASAVDTAVAAAHCAGVASSTSGATAVAEWAHSTQGEWHDSGAQAERELQHALARASALAVHEAKLRSAAEIKAQAAEARAVRAEEGARSKISALEANMAEERRDTRRQRRELEEQCQALQEALERAETKVMTVTQRAEEAERAAALAASAAVEAVGLATQEASAAVREEQTALEERCIAAESTVAAFEREVAARAAARRDAATEPIRELVLAEQAEATRTNVLARELRVLTARHEHTEKCYVELIRRTGRWRRIAEGVSSDGTTSDGGAESSDCDGSADTGERHASDLRRSSCKHTGSSKVDGVHSARVRRAERQKLAGALLVWYTCTRRERRARGM